MGWSRVSWLVQSLKDNLFDFPFYLPIGQLSPLACLLAVTRSFYVSRSQALISECSKE